MRAVAVCALTCLAIFCALVAGTQGRADYVFDAFPAVSDAPKLSYDEQVAMVREAQRSGDWSEVTANRDYITAYPV